MATKFRELDDITEVCRNGNFVKGMNFTLRIIRTVVNPTTSDGSDKARIVIELKKPLRQAM